MDINTLANGAIDWIKINQSSINECIQQTIPAADRTTTVQTVIKVGQERNRITSGGMAFGVGQLKSKLIKELGYTTEQANAAVSRLKSDERLFQIGRGLGKMLVVFNGDPKQLNTTPHANGGLIWDVNGLTVQPQTTGTPYTNMTPMQTTATGWDVPQAMPMNYAELVAKEPPGTRLQTWLAAAKPDRKKVAGKTLSGVLGNIPVELENPAVPDYGDLQEIYDEIEASFKEKFAKLKAKCDEIMEENMVLNQATWQS